MKEVWSASIGLLRINVYSIGISCGDLFDYRTYRLNEIAIYQNPDSPEADILKQKNREDWNRVCKAAAANPFDQLRVIPTSLWVGKKEFKEYPEDDEYIFFTGGRNILNQKCGEIFKQFNLGQNHLVPLHMYDVETGELWTDETFYVLKVCEQRRYMLNPQSHSEFQFIPYPDGGGVYAAATYGIEDNDVELSQSALECDVDLWHDPLLSDSYFMSDRLKAALSEANMAEKFGFALCKLI